MKKMSVLVFVMAAGMFSLQAAVTPHVGFVYPAGARPGTKVTVVIGGQYLKEFKGINISGVQTEAVLADYLRIYDQKEGGALRRRKEVLEAKIAEGKSDILKQQMQKQIGLLETEIAMAMEVRREERMNPAMAAKKQFNPQISERLTIEITIPANAEPGEHELRVITAAGLSNPLFFHIGQMAEVEENEPNDLTASAEMLSAAFPLLINGQIMPGDTDCFRFHALKGQTLVFRAEARSLVPYLADAVPGWFQAVMTLYDSKGREVAYDDDFRFDPDPVLIYEVPEDGDYTLSVRDSIFRGREDFVYRISAGELPFIERIFPLGGKSGTETEVDLYGVNLPISKLRVKASANAPETQTVQVEKGGLLSNKRVFGASPLPDRLEQEPNNTLAEAIAVSNSVVFNGIIGKPGDWDWFCFQGRKGEHKTIEVAARRLGSPLDARLTLFNSKNEVLASGDDTEDKTSGLLTHHADTRINTVLPDNGTYFVRLDDVQGKGGSEYAYRLMIGEEIPDFQLRVVPASLRIPREGTALITVHAIRTGGFTGRVDISVSDAPRGIELQRAVIPEGADSARIVIAAANRTANQIIPLHIEGTAKSGLRTIVRKAVPAEDMMQAFIYRHLVPAQQMLTQITEPDPVTVTLNLPPGGVIRARPGSEITLTALVERTADAQGVIKLALSEPPEWLTLGTETIGRVGGSEVILNVSPNAEPGNKANVLLNGTTRIGKSPKSPDFNPVEKFFNAKPLEFTIDALVIEIIN
jgi:hypothetical protein